MLGRACPDHMRELADPTVPLAHKVVWLREYLRVMAMASFDGDRPLWHADCYFHPYQDKVRQSLPAIDDVMRRLADRESRDTLQLLLYGSPEDYLEHFLKHAFHHQQYTDLILLKPGDNIVNAGIGSGWDIPFFRAFTRTRGRHVVVEPGPMPDKYRQAPFEPVEYGLWDKEETLSFNIIGAGMLEAGKASGGGQVQTVKCLPLDRIARDLGLERIDLIKLDIEGAEPRALEGMKQTLQRCRPQIAIAIYHEPNHMWELPATLMSWLPNYRFYIRHYGMCRFECLLYAIPEEKFPAASKPAHHDALEKRLGLDPCLEETTWNCIVSGQPLAQSLPAASASDVAWHEHITRQLQKGFASCDLPEEALPLDLLPGAPEFLGSGWSPSGHNRSGQSWRWIGKLGAASVFLRLRRDRDVSCRVYLQDAANQQVLDALRLEANGVSCVRSATGKDDAGLFHEYALPKRAFKSSQGRCHLVIKTLPGERHVCVQKLVLADATTPAPEGEGSPQALSASVAQAAHPQRAPLLRRIYRRVFGRRGASQTPNAPK
ncbi:MAG: FkbM family methyltransferase [Gemmataceae bacterium]